MNIKGFFVEALSSALDLGVATADDVLRHVTPDVLSLHLPRPLWARLITAALGAPKVDAQLVIETIGLPNLCEHVPSTIIWSCIAELAQRALSGVPAQPISAQAAATPPAMKAPPILIAAPPPEIKQDPPAPEVRRDPPPPEIRRESPPRGTPLPSVGSKPADGLADVVAALESNERQPMPSGRSRTPTGQRFRQPSTSTGRLGAINTRRPQVPVSAADEVTRAAAAAPGASSPARRGQADADAYDIESSELKEDWKSSLAVEDEQLVDWQASEETVTTGEHYRKR